MMVNWPSKEVAQFFGIFTFFVQYFIPIAIIIFSYIAMIRAMNSQSSLHKEQNRKEKKEAEIRKNILKTLALVCLCFIICLGPNQIYFLLINTGFDLPFGTPLYDFTVCLMFLNCAVNPICYGLQYREFRAQARRLFCRVCDRNQVVTDDITSSTESQSGGGQ